MYQRDKSADPNNIPLFSSSILNNANTHNPSITLTNSNLNTISSVNTNTINLQNPDMSNINKTLGNLLDSLNLNKGIFLNDEYSMIFKKKIDKLNLRFYMETDKYLSNKTNTAKCQDTLFIILFKQISLYMEELQRSNSIIREYRNEILQQKSKEENRPNTKVLNKSEDSEMEKHLFKHNQQISKLKIENESLKRQIVFFKDKLKLDINKRTTSQASSILTLNNYTNSSIDLQQKNKECAFDKNNKDAKSNYMTNQSQDTEKSIEINSVCRSLNNNSNIDNERKNDKTSAIKQNFSMKNFNKFELIKESKAQRAKNNSQPEILDNPLQLTSGTFLKKSMTKERIQTANQQKNRKHSDGESSLMSATMYFSRGFQSREICLTEVSRVSKNKKEKYNLNLSNKKLKNPSTVIVN